MYYAPCTNEVRTAPDRAFVVPLGEQDRVGPNRSIIPGTTLQWVYDSVSLRLLQSCLRKYYWSINAGWSEKERSPALSWGIAFHTCIETLHKCLAHGLEYEVATLRVARLAALLGEQIVSLDTSRSKETLVRSVVWYCDEYKNDPVQTAMLPNGKPAVELSFMIPVFDLEVAPTDELPALEIEEVIKYFGAEVTSAKVKTALSQGRKLFGKLISNSNTTIPPSWLESFYSITIYFSGHLDRVVHFGDEVFVLDYKSSKYPLDLTWVQGFDRSTQFFGYYTAAHILSSQPNTVFPTPPAGILVDGIQIGVNFTRFARFPLRYSTAVANEFLENFEALVRTKAEPAARLGYYPSESESACHHYRRADGTGGCEFLPVCNASPADRARQLKQRFRVSIWDCSVTR